MLEAMRRFFRTRAGMAVATGLLLIGLVVAVLTIKDMLSSEGAKISARRVYIDAQTGKSFEHELSPGETNPVKAPSGGKTGYPAEKCTWTKDGKVKAEPTW